MIAPSSEHFSDIEALQIKGHLDKIIDELTLKICERNTKSLQLINDFNKQIDHNQTCNQVNSGVYVGVGVVATVKGTSPNEYLHSSFLELFKPYHHIHIPLPSRKKREDILIYLLTRIGMTGKTIEQQLSSSNSNLQSLSRKRILKVSNLLSYKTDSYRPNELRVIIMKAFQYAIERQVRTGQGQFHSTNQHQQQLTQQSIQEGTSQLGASIEKKPLELQVELQVEGEDMKSSSLNPISLEYEDLLHVMKDFIPLSLKSNQKNDDASEFFETWDSVGGLEMAKESLIEILLLPTK